MAVILIFAVLELWLIQQ